MTSPCFGMPDQSLVVMRTIQHEKMNVYCKKVSFKVNDVSRNGNKNLAVFKEVLSLK